ncbi:DUF2232 domain-containing protein [Staphylococcus agnetis]|uniref:DUF2232 domain-containing protein n=1 Tax=Staphylococcus agnetis TaxID=985762 RepID=A0A2T4ME17_9STAP|nr:DUF2232 domain-containing protein [Staphylococcus agnetis]NHM74344.1 DUF2232 domain-containing protein [Staphylococcus sp. 11007852]NHM92401.1 DUF2232 domain-containing protein [Staphylococcus sp. 10602379]ALN77638.1 DUF2232 domain-containing protein [Staphylococcus agnetis]MCO4342360.1 DUF2232 domain-containing protein [Staphylococcus agnetis]MCO4354133.1 DUF2232 domain-containing protein [Staphylococcus agnetis]
MFSKIKPKDTILGTIALILVALVMHFIPILGVIVIFFAPLPGIILWYRSKYSFGIAALVSIMVATITGSLFVQTFMIILLLASLIISQLLLIKASKERILYVVSFVTSLVTLGVMIFLQSIKKLPYAHELIEPYKIVVDETIRMQNLDAQSAKILEASVQQMAVQMPSFIVISITLFFMLSLLIMFPILRQFKVATPVYRPLYLWQLRKSIFIIYAIALLVSIVTEPSTTANSISQNFIIVLGFLLVIQGLSFIHYACSIKKFPIGVSVLLIIIGIIAYPLTRLIGLLDLGLNLKSMLKKR